MKNKSNFKVIEGGLLPKEKANKKFVSAYTTDTRLMGAYGVFVQWELEGSFEYDDLFQYFYFDTEEFGFDSYESIWGLNLEAVKTLEQTAISCLGGCKIELTEKEVCYLVNYYAEFNNVRKIPLPPLTQEYQFVLDNKVILSDQEKDILINKICTPITNKYQLAHYFLMRTFGKDFVGAKYLATKEVNTDIYPHLKMATFCRNSITVDPNDPHTLICESLIEADDKYEIITTKIIINNKKIQNAIPLDKMKISSSEAAMILAKPEFITVYEVNASPEEMANKTLEFSFNTMVRPHETGKLFLKFHDNNDHVKSKTFLLSADVQGLYFITDFGQFIVAAYNATDIRNLEYQLAKNDIGKYLIPTGRYEFKDPVLYDFINSEIDDFDDFLDIIRDDGE
ncbi:MAG: hypothetical protein RSA49_01475 [Anaerovoracaceae bacterium]